MRFRETGLEYELRDGLYYPKMETPKSRAEMSIKARRAMDMLNALNPSALDAVNTSGLGDRIWEEIADKVKQKEEELHKTLHSNLPTDWNSRAQRETEIASEVERQGDRLMNELVNLMSREVMILPHLSDVRNWQLP